MAKGKKGGKGHSGHGLWSHARGQRGGEDKQWPVDALIKHLYDKFSLRLTRNLICLKSIKIIYAPKQQEKDKGRERVVGKRGGGAEASQLVNSKLIQ